MKLYVVHGPTAEWGDGSGPLGVFRWKGDAEQFVRTEKEYNRTYGLKEVWPYDHVDYSIEQTTPEALSIPEEVYSDEAALDAYLTSW
jgi:hypothetical protein